MTKTDFTSADRKAQAKHKKYLARALKIHGDKYDYSRAFFSSSAARVKIKCRSCATVFTPTVNNHLSNKSGCPSCNKGATARKAKAEYIRKARKKHGQKYDYSAVQYRGSRAKIKILCPKHGPFTQTAAQHLRYGCADCGKEKAAELLAERNAEIKFTGADFERESRKIYGDLLEYDHSSFISTKKPVRIKCRTHGWVEVSARSHLFGKPSTPCPGCRKDEAEQQRETKRKEAARQKRHRDFMRALTAESEAEKKAERLAKNREARRKRSERNFITRARKIHGDVYEYDPETMGFKKATGRVNIICKQHGVFNQKIQSHIDRRRGCPVCGAERSAGWTREAYIKKAEHSNGGRAMLYLIRLTSETEIFYKIGITSKPTVRDRFTNKDAVNKAYEIKVLKTIKGDAGFIYDAEKQFHKMNKKHKYEPAIKFGGHTECFSEITDDARFLLDVI